MRACMGLLILRLRVIIEIRKWRSEQHCDTSSSGRYYNNLASSNGIARAWWGENMEDSRVDIDTSATVEMYCILVETLQ